MSYLSKGDVIVKNGEWLILDICNGFCLMVLLHTTRTKLASCGMDILLEELEDGIAELKTRNSNECNMISIMDYGASARNNERMRSMAERILKKDENLFWLLNRTSRSQFISALSTEYSVSTYTIRRFLHDYLQNNLSLHKMKCGYVRCGGKGKIRTYENGRRAGRKGISQVGRTEELLIQFEEMKKRYIKCKGRLSISSLYEDLCMKYYSIRKVAGGEVSYDIYAAANRPTKRQLYYYMQTHCSEHDRYVAEHGQREAWNNKRALHSDTIANLTMKSIGSRYEMDEMETDYYLVSRMNQNEVIGRAILYLTVDVFSKMITGFHVGVENNSWNGAKMALLNMAEDKVEVCRRVGITIEESDWPSFGMVPYEFEVDNGAEYVGNRFEEYTHENGINLTVVPSRMGSFKSNVEQKFHQFNSFVQGRLPGEIVKGQYGSPHVAGAKLTIEDFYKIVLQFILAYNKTPLTDYPSDKDVFASGIIPSPLNIWNLKQQKENALRKIENMNQYKYSLLDQARATITREGIVFKKVIYTCERLEWLDEKMRCVAFEGREHIDIRFDRRNMDFIYFELNGEIIRGWINERKTGNEKYMGCALHDIEMINKRIKEDQILIADGRLEQKVNLNAKVDTIVKDSKRRHSGRNSKKNIGWNRAEEKLRLQKETQIVMDADIKEKPALDVSKNTELVTPVKKDEIDVSKMSTVELFAYMRNKEYEE